MIMENNDLESQHLGRNVKCTGGHELGLKGFANDWERTEKREQNLVWGQ
jgi:hypothetical protein